MLFAFPFPAIDPVLIELGPLTIRWYALAYIAGLLLGWAMAQALVKRPGLFGPAKPPTLRDLDDFLVWAMIGIVLGGRIGFVLFYNLPYYLENPGEIVQLWHGGMSFHGGLVGLALAVWLFSRRRELAFFTMMDIVATVTPIGLLFGRLANFINGELYGRLTGMPWAVLFPRGGYAPRHPSQLYEAALEGIVLFILLLLAISKGKTLQRPGLTSSLFLIGYGLARFTVEFFREPDMQLGFLWGGATMGQLLSLPMIAIGVVLLVIVQRREMK